MPLHLLGKKSWNVYNQDNIERVKRDEAAAAAREAAEEQRMQEVDAERRIQTLRGIIPSPALDASPAPNEPLPSSPKGPSSSIHKHDRKRRRIAGEDDTARDIRFALEDQRAHPSSAAKPSLQLTSTKTSDAPITDHRGHISLFPPESSRNHPATAKNAEVEAEKAKKKREYEDQYTMRFSNAAGFKQSVGEKPWYHTLGSGDTDEVEVPSKDVWGNEDPRRKEREKMRVAADDPMAAMQKGVSQLREVERERKRWEEERAKEMREIEETERRKRRRKERRRREEDEGLEGFSLGAPAVHDRDAGEHRSERRHKHRHRHRSREHSHHRHQSHRHDGDRHHERTGHGTHVAQVIA